MSDEMKILERVGERITAGLGDGPSPDRMEAQRRAWMAHVASSSRNTPRVRPLVVFSAVSAAAAAVLLMVLVASLAVDPDDAAPIAFWVGDQREAGSAGSWVHAEGRTPIPIRFDNGSRMEIDANGAARVVESTVEKVDVNLSGGKLHADIKRTADTSWQVNAGPYTVTVLGTEFAVDWNTDTSTLGVSVTRGKVLVQGGNLNEHGIRLVAGKRLVANGEDGSVAVEPIAAGDEAVAVAAEDTAENGIPEGDSEIGSGKAAIASGDAKGTDGMLAKSSPRSLGERRTSDRWKELFLDRDYGGAVAAAEERGIDDLLATLDREDLWRLGNAARYARRPAISERVYLEVRSRFAGSGRAASAAFMLGRIQLDEFGNFASAAEWFDRYLEEAPFGPLAEEALGRLIDACDKAGHGQEAERRSREYLSRYQSGPFAKLAESVLQK